MSRPVLILREALLAAPLVAFVVALPGALRLAGERVGLVEGWIGAAGLVCPMLAVGLVAARGARRALGATPSIAVPLACGAALWVLIALPATTALGAVLKANTHHRGLAGATYAVFALVVHAFAALLAWRLTANVLPLVRSASARSALALALAGAALILLAFGVAKGAPPADAGGAGGRIAALLVDGAVALAAIALAAAVDFPSGSHAGTWKIGAALVVVLAIVGLWISVRSPSLVRGAQARAPLAGVVAEMLGISVD